MDYTKREVCRECGTTLTNKEKELAEEFGSLLCEICEARQSDSPIFIEEDANVI